MTSEATAAPRRPVLAGNGLAGRCVLEMMLQGWEPADVLVLAPPAGDRHAWHPDLGEEARAREVPVIQADRVNDASVVARLRDHGADLLLSAYFTQIFDAELLAAVSGPAINFHPSLLPRHRGTAPLIWAIAEGDRETGVSAHLLDEGIDTGPLVAQRSLPIHEDDTGYSLHLKAGHLVRSLASSLVRDLLAGRGLPDPIEQTGEASYHGRRDPRLNHLDWSQPRHRIRNVVRALAPPLPGAYSSLAGERIVLARVDIAQSAPARPPGMVEVDPGDGGLLAWAGDGALRIERVLVGDVQTGGQELVGRLGLRGGEQLT